MERAPGTHCIGNWESPRSCLDAVEKTKFFTLLGLELQLVAIPTALLLYVGVYFTRYLHVARKYVKIVDVNDLGLF
jgi:hypothetical protein